MYRVADDRRPDRPRDPSRIRTDGAGGLFEQLAAPAIEYRSGTDGPVVSRVNPAFRETFPAVDAGGSLSTALASVTTSGEYEAVLEATRLGERSRVTCTCETATGETAFSVRTNPAEDGGYVLFVDLPATERLDRLDYLTHSLRNPLEVATLHTEVMAERDSLEYVETVQRAHERIEAILTDTVALAEQEAVVEGTAPVELDAVARDAWATVRTDDATLQVDSPGTVEADERRLRVLFENLFRNAVRHGTEGGIDASDEIRVTVGAHADGFYVADNGRGVPAEDRDRLLEFGYTTDEDGTGLGLAIVAEIVRRHGWDITVTGSADGGMRFEFTAG